MPFVNRNRGKDTMGFRPLGYKDGAEVRKGNPSRLADYWRKREGEGRPKPKELKWLYGDRTMPSLGIPVSEQNAEMRSGNQDFLYRADVHRDLLPKLDFLKMVLRPPILEQRFPEPRTKQAQKEWDDYVTYKVRQYRTDPIKRLEALEGLPFERQKEVNALMWEGLSFEEALAEASESLNYHERRGLIRALAREGDEQFLKRGMDASTANLELEQALREKFYGEEKPVSFLGRRDVPEYRKNQEVLDEREKYRRRLAFKKDIGGMANRLMATGYFGAGTMRYPWREEYDYQDTDPVMMPDEARAAMRFPVERRNRGGLMSLRRR